MVTSIKQIPQGDKFGHAFLYGTLSFLLNYALVFKRVKNTKLFLGSLLVLAFAVLEEITQIWIPLRTFDWIDLVGDVVGIIIYSFLSVWYRNRFMNP